MDKARLRQVKASLTRAERSKDPAKMLAAADAAERVFEEIGYPDWWSRIERLRMDAHFFDNRSGDFPAASVW